MKESIAKDKMKFIMKCKMVFLETKIVATPITGKSFVITTSMYSKKRHSYQHLNPKSYHTKNQIKNTPIVVANRIRRNRPRRRYRGKYTKYSMSRYDNASIY